MDCWHKCPRLVWLTFATVDSTQHTSPPSLANAEKNKLSQILPDIPCQTSMKPQHISLPSLARSSETKLVKGKGTSTKTRAITPAVRSRERPQGLPNVSQNMKRKIKIGNLHGDFVYRVVGGCCRLCGVGYFVENPDGSFLWIQPAWVASGWALMENSYRFDQCRFAAAWRKTHPHYFER